jgi:hypothetical protein
VGALPTELRKSQAIGSFDSRGELVDHARRKNCHRRRLDPLDNTPLSRPAVTHTAAEKAS